MNSTPCGKQPPQPIITAGQAADKRLCELNGRLARISELLGGSYPDNAEGVPAADGHASTLEDIHRRLTHAEGYVSRIEGILGSPENRMCGSSNTITIGGSALGQALAGAR